MQLVNRLWIILPSILVVFFLWLPFGFNLGALIEEWGILGLFTQNKLFFIADAESLLSEHRIRPLTILPQAIAYFFDPNSFFFWHILLIVSLILKGSAICVLTWFLTKSRRISIFCGMLVLLYPADTMQFSFRALHINWALSFFLIATVCQVYAYDVSARATKLVLAIIGMLCLAIACLMYELVLFVAPLPFLLLFVKDGFRATCQQLWRQRWITFGWIAVIIAYFVYVVYIMSQEASAYQSPVLGGIPKTPRELLSLISMLVKIAMMRALFGGWFDAGRILLSEFSHYAYLLFVLSCFIGVIYFSGRKKSKFPARNLPFISRFLFAGLVLLVLGYLPYLLSVAHIMITQRTYLFATIGATFFWIAILVGIAGYNRYLAAILGSIMLLCGTAAQLFQQEHYNRVSNSQKNILATIVKNVPSIKSDQQLLILDSSGRLHHTWMLIPNLRYTLTYLYGKPLKEVDVCLLPGNLWSSYTHVPDVRFGQCIENKKSWIFTDGHKPIKEVLKKDLVIIKIEKDGSVKNAPVVNISADAVKYQDKRIQNILMLPPWSINLDLFKHPSANSYRWDFGRWWNLDIPVRGVGWREVEWNPSYLRHKAFAWKNAPISTVLFDLTPENKNYMLEGKVHFISSAMKETLKVAINGHEIKVHWQDEHSFSAKIQSNWLQKGINEIAFISSIDIPASNPGLALTWFSINAK